MTNKKCITSYPRKNTDWKYINYLESNIKELKEENKRLKEGRRSLINKNRKLFDEKEKLENKLAYYKQSLL